MTLSPTTSPSSADAFDAPLRYVRGNHDVGAAWSATRRTLLPEPMRDGQVVDEDGLRLVGFSGSPTYNDRGMQVSALGMWSRVIRSSSAAQRASPVIVVSHAPPRDINDDHDRAHRGFTAFRWLVDRLAPPLWLHGHTALVRRGMDDRCAQHNGTLFYNCTGATLIELRAPDARWMSRSRSGARPSAACWWRSPPLPWRSSCGRPSSAWRRRATTPR